TAIHLVVSILNWTATTLVDCRFGGGQRVMILHEPLYTVVVSAFLVGGERHNQIPVGLITLLLQANESCNPDGGHCFIVACSSSVEESVFFGKLERIQRPVFS